MKFNSTILAVAAMATFASAVDNVTESASADMVKRAAFAINDILKRHVESDAAPCTPGSFCSQKFTDLGNIASAAIDGYDSVRSEDDDAAEPTDLINFCDDGTTFCVRKRTAEPEAARVVKRCSICFGGCTPAAAAECKKLHQLHYHMNHYRGPVAKSKPPLKPNWCLAPYTYCFRKRDVPVADHAELVQEGGVAHSLHQIKDAINGIKSDAGPYGPSDDAMSYFHDIEDRVDAAMYSLQQE